MRIAITGSIACGKSTVLHFLQARGYPVIDADVVSRALTAPGGEALPAIREAFGDGVFDGEVLNRKALADVVFSDPAAKSRLEAILHPLIRARMLHFLDQQEGRLAFAEVPLLFETGMERDYDAVWVVSAPEHVRIERLRTRDGLNESDALKRIHAQMPLSEKEKRADAVISTDGPFSEIERQLDELLAEYDRKADSPTEAPDSGKTESWKKKGNTVTAFFLSLPVWLRIVLAAVASTLLLSLTVLILRDYTARQELRRQMELEAAERASHPLYYRDFIEEGSLINALDPALVSAVILCESSFHPDAVSRLGARGLMQIMEDTAGWIAHRLGEDDETYSFDRLFDPETSIRYGTWYLGYLSKRFGADPKKIICAYHAGQGNVDAWLKNSECSHDGITLDVIPTKDTQQYYKRVSDAIAVYKKYYFPDEPEGGDSEPTSVGV